MSLLDKMSQNNDPDDDSQNSASSFDNIPLDRPRRKRTPPHLLESRAGRRKISFAALIERIVTQFEEENTPDDSAVRAAQTPADRARLLLPVVDYVFSVESIDADNEVKAGVMGAVYSELFGLGPLDPLIDDDTITTITLEGAEKVSIRYGNNDLIAANPIFDSEEHLRKIIGRLVQQANATLNDDLPLIEVGLQTESDRFLSASIAGPPIAYTLNADIRLHPTTAPTLDGLIERETFTAQAAQFIRALVQSEYGFMVAGQPESGKTMTLSAILGELPHPGTAVAVERTGELHLPNGMTRAVVRWPVGDNTGVTFGEQIQAQLDAGHTTMVLDEVRADEPHSIEPLLKRDSPPRLIWSFRGAPDSKRLLASLGMLARRSAPGGDDSDTLVQNLFARLPFVVSVRRLSGKIELREVGEWVPVPKLDTVRYVTLMQTSGGDTELTGNQPTRSLPGLNAAFWQNGRA
jgi:type IV secretory pathway ATPase VirB11/archaellum biosynthesis ATPase